MSHTYTITALPTGTGWWALESDVGSVSQVRRLDRAADELREAVAHQTGIAAGDLDLVVVPVLPEGVPVGAGGGRRGARRGGEAPGSCRAGVPSGSPRSA